MSDVVAHGMRFRFSGFELEPDERRLLAHGEPLALTPKVFDTLVMLVARAGHVVSRDALMAALWPRGFVTDASLAKHIWVIRKLLGGHCSDGSRFIETVPKLGYRFAAPVQPLADDLPVQSQAQSDDTHSMAHRRAPLDACVRADENAHHELTHGIAVAVAAFRHLSTDPDNDWLGPALTMMLATEIATSGRTHVVPGERVRPALGGASTSAVGGFAPSSLAKLRQRSGADYVISGSYLVTGTVTDARLRVDVVLQDARNADELARFSESRPETRLLALVANAGRRLRSRLRTRAAT